MNRPVKNILVFLFIIYLVSIPHGYCDFEDDALDSDFDDGDIYNHRMNMTFRATFAGTPASFDIYDANADGKLEFIIISQGGFYLVAHDGEELTHLVEGIESVELNVHNTDDNMSSAFGADLDGDNLPEIYITTVNGLYVWEYDMGSKTWVSQGVKEDIIIDRYGTGSYGAMCRTNIDQDSGDEFLIYDQNSNFLILDSVEGEVILLNAGTRTAGGQWSTVGDIDNDGTHELLLWGGELGIYRYEKSTKTYELKLVTDISPKFVACADYDKDGDHELYVIAGYNTKFDGKDYPSIGRVLLDINHEGSEWSEEIIHKDDYYTRSGALLYDNDIAAGDITNNGEAELVAWLNQPNNGALEILYMKEDPSTAFKLYFQTFYDRQNLNYGLYVCDSDADGRKEVVSLQRVWRASGSMLGGGSIDISGLTNIIVTEWTDPASRMGIFNLDFFIKAGVGVGAVIALIVVVVVMKNR